MKQLLVLFFLGFLSAYRAQEFATVSGKVSNEKGETLLGASVIYRADVSKGTIARDDGSFELIVPPGQCKLICRYTGMRSDTVSFDLSPNEQKIVDFTPTA